MSSNIDISVERSLKIFGEVSPRQVGDKTSSVVSVGFPTDIARESQVGLPTNSTSVGVKTTETQVGLPTSSISVGVKTTETQVDFSTKKNSKSTLWTKYKVQVPKDQRTLKYRQATVKELCLCLGIEMVEETKSKKVRAKKSEDKKPRKQSRKNELWNQYKAQVPQEQRTLKYRKVTIKELENALVDKEELGFEAYLQNVAIPIDIIIAPTQHSVEENKEIESESTRSNDSSSSISSLSSAEKEINRKEKVCYYLKTGEKEIEEVAKEVWEEICLDYPDDQFRNRAGQRSSKRSLLNTSVRKEVEHLKDTLIQAKYLLFRDWMNKLAANDQCVTKTRYADRLRERKEINKSLNKEPKEKVEINTKEILDWCDKVLTNPAQNKWYHIAIALGICTGRRIISEIMTTTSQYVKKSKYEISFTNPAKKKVSDITSTIPTLIESEKIITSIKFLQEFKGIKKNKHNEDDQETRHIAHAKYSANLGKHWKKQAKRFNLDLFHKNKSIQKVLKELKKLHGTRKLYTGITLAKEKIDFNTDLDKIRNRAAEILCHESEDICEFYRMPIIFKL